MNALTTTPQYQVAPATIQHLEAIKSNFGVIQAAMDSVLVKKIHYGVIPGTGQSRPVLLKPGADVLCSLFHFAPKYETAQNELGNEHREYIVNCLLYDVAGNKLGEGLGLCSTMEKKYRYRAGEGEVTETPVPKDFWDVRNSDPAKAAKILTEAANKAGFPGQKFGTKKNDDGQWRISTYGERVENDCIADVYNTCLKMAAKRALVSAVLTVTGASAVFTQDVEDMTDNIIDAEFDTAPAPAEEPASDPEALFNELAAKAALTKKKEKDQLRQFIGITAQAQNREFVDVVSRALIHFDAFAAAFANWLKMNEAPKKTATEPEKPAEEQTSAVPEDAPVTPETLQAIAKELDRIGGTGGYLPPHLEKRYETGDPSELSEVQGQDALKDLKTIRQ